MGHRPAVRGNSRIDVGGPLPSNARRSPCRGAAQRHLAGRDADNHSTRAWGGEAFQNLTDRFHRRPVQLMLDFLDRPNAYQFSPWCERKDEGAVEL